MTDVLAISLNGMQQDMARLERISMNMANAATPGYKREVVASLPSNGAAFSDAMQAAGAVAGDIRADTPGITPAMLLIRAWPVRHPGLARNIEDDRAKPGCRTGHARILRDFN